MAIYHIFLNPNYGDDLWFGKILDQSSWGAYLSFRYHNWTSRIVIEGVLVLLTRAPIALWKVCNILMWVLLAISISKLFVRRNAVLTNWILVASIFFIPMPIMAEAGLIATTLNYLWPTALGLLSLYPIYKMCHHQTVHWWEYPLYIIAILFSTSSEQWAAILFVVYILVLGYRFYNKQVDWVLLLGAALAGAALVFTLTCPGNALRSAQETETWFPAFGQFTLLQKAKVGYIGLVRFFAFAGNWGYMIMALCLAVLVWRTTRSWAWRITSILPVSLAFPLVPLVQKLQQQGIGTAYLPNDLFFSNTVTALSKIEWLLLAYITLAVISLFLLLLKVFGKSWETILVVLVGGAGFMSKLVVGFSPTVFASGQRTSFVLAVSILVITVMLFQKLWDTEKKHPYYVPTVLLACGCLQYALCIARAI